MTKDNPPQKLEPLSDVALGELHSRIDYARSIDLSTLDLVDLDELESLVAEVSQRREQEKHYGWGIVDRRGEPYRGFFNAESRALEQFCADLNGLSEVDDPWQQPFRVVELFWRALAVEPQKESK